ncbi:unnamed protein product [Enterobius vermicularis]|uniref:Threonylcarbamoyl-AMP synthase n=1 Tax=Enterobius vermicularis TaxID=51028 RepID=A0A0N4UWD2_ENTVE|nr:unnamed protein product [Enterobius vermicularis]
MISAFEFALSEAAKVLKDGGVIALPTDTLYGLVATVRNVHKIYNIKQRNFSKPCGLFISDVGQVKKWCSTKLEESTLTRLLPGPVTLLFFRSDHLPSEFNQGIKTVGIRIPKHDFVTQLTKKLTAPLAQTSANLSGDRNPRCIEDFCDLWSKLDLVIDGGEIKGSPGHLSGEGSTVVDMSYEGTYSIIRDGTARTKTEEILRDCGLVARTDGELFAQSINTLPGK